ncbi:MAG: hypothetical protein ABI743_02820 [bacterium]
MRITSALALSSLTAALLSGCSGSTAGPVIPSSTPLPVPQWQPATDPDGLQIANAGEFRFHIDVPHMSVTVEPLQRTGSTIADLYYLNVNQFGVGVGHPSLGPYDPFDQTIVLKYEVWHSFPAPSNPTGPASASNRADLGITGRVVFLVDAPDSRTTSDLDFRYTGDYEFPFTAGPVVLNPKAIRNPDGYYDPAGMTDHVRLNGTTAYPFKVLVDESDPNARTNTADGTPIPRGASSQGNWSFDDPWSSLALVTPNRLGWTGYGFLHQGQSAKNSMQVSVDPNNPAFSMDAVVIASYVDPRGGSNAAQRRINRLPGEGRTFKYNVPHGATDLERVWTETALSWDGLDGSGFNFTVAVVDQDAILPAGNSIASPPNPSGLASIEVANSELGVSGAGDAPTMGTGRWENPMWYPAEGLVNNTGGDITGGTDNGIWIALRVEDEQAALPPSLASGFTLNNASPPVPVAAGQEQHTVVYQALFVPIP